MSTERSTCWPARWSASTFASDEPGRVLSAAARLIGYETVTVTPASRVMLPIVAVA
jgi:hypothetical protein